MLLLRERGLQLIRDIPEEVKALVFYGDQIRIQQVLADFLLNMVRCAPSPGGWVEIQLRPSVKQVSEGMTIAHIEFRYDALYQSCHKIFGLSILLSYMLNSYRLMHDRMGFIF